MLTDEETTTFLNQKQEENITVMSCGETSM